MSLIFLLLCVISVYASEPFWPSAYHDGRGSNCAHVPLPIGPPMVAWEGFGVGPNHVLPLTPLVDENGSIIILSDSDNAPKAIIWSATGIIQGFPSFCSGIDPSVGGNTFNNFIILPGGCVVAPCMTWSVSPGEPVSFSLIAVPGATENQEACAGIVPWTTETLEPFDIPFQANLQTPIVDESGQYIMSIDAYGEEACNNDEECDFYLSLLALRIGEAQETKITLAACDSITSGQSCPGSGSYTNGVISGSIGSRVFFSLNTGTLNAVTLDQGGTIVALYIGCISRLAASTEGTVYCVGANYLLMGWTQSGPVGPSIPLIPGSTFLAVGLGPSALVIVAVGNLLLCATLQLEQVWNVTLPGSAGPLVIDENSIIVSTSWGLVSYRVSDGFLLWTSVGLATDATNLVSAAPYTLVAMSSQHIYYLVRHGTPTTPTSSITPTKTSSRSVIPSVSPTPTETPTSTVTRTISLSITRSRSKSGTKTSSSSATETTSGTTTPSQTISSSITVTSSETVTQTVSPTMTNNSISPTSMATPLPTLTIVIITFSTLAAGMLIACFSVKVNAAINKSTPNKNNPFLIPLMINGDA